jgi:hypothetical protein
MRADVQAEITHVLPLLKEAGWDIQQIQWEVSRESPNERRICFTAKSRTGKRVHLTCPETSLPERIARLLDSR